jgi:hypothetical protein
VQCGGYKKDFKWRPFEEATFVNKIAPSRPKKTEIRSQENHDGLPREKIPASRPSPEKTPKIELIESPSNSDGSSDPGPDGGDSAVQDHIYSPLQSPALSHVHHNSFSDHMFQSSMGFGTSLSPIMRNAGMSIFHANQVTSSLDSLFSEPEVPQSRSGQSPRLIDLLLPGSELNAPRPAAVEQPPIDQSDQFQYMPDMMHDPILDEDIEEIIRQPLAISSHDMWMMARDPMYSVYARSPTPSPCTIFADPLYKLYRQPELRTNSTEMLMLLFDRQTCGILSVKDGPTENPWRTLIWPLARDSPALYHAIASMTAFHTSKEKPGLRVDGMEHMRRSIRALATGIEKMRTDTALATTLALAFSESWDVHISTGIEHLRGARILVNQALERFSAAPVYGDDLARLKFLCNTWVYMDVIARLTSDSDSAGDTDFTALLAPLYSSSADASGTAGDTTPLASDVDPLMGCASTLFPLLGRVATLVRSVRSTPTNSIALISSSLSLQDSLLLWTPPPLFTPPEDPTSDIQHGLQTAEAYRYATLLFLHQAVPEIPSLSSAKLAKKTLVYLATVPVTSRLIIVQIFPLLAAGCEVVEEADRVWVRERWREMERRMLIGNLEKCLMVTEEVWRRRDAYEAAMARREAAKMAKKVVLASAKTRFEAEMASLEEVLCAGGEHGMRTGLGGKSAMRAARGGDNAMGEGNATCLKRRLAPPSTADGAASASKRRRKSADEGIGEEEPEFTVRGRLHWLEVMKEWDWEGSLHFLSLLPVHEFPSSTVSCPFLVSTSLKITPPLALLQRNSSSH